MKKLLFFVAAFATLFTSCSKDEAASYEAYATFTVSTPDVNTRYGDGKSATTLHYAVYDQDGKVDKLCGSKAIDITTNVELKLIQGRSYEVIFWAQAAGAPYSVEWGEEADDASMTIPATVSLEANNEDYDAFFNYTDLGTVSGAMNKTIYLTRPFAQLNIATGDTEAAADAELVVTKTAVKVSNIYNTLNFKSGEVSGESVTTFTLADRAEGTIEANDTEYEQIAMNYLLVGAKSRVVNVELTINDEGLTRSYKAVPVQRNYRTNIVGNILTSPAQFTVEIKPGFTEPDYIITDQVATAEELAEAIAAGLPNIKLTENVALTENLDIPEDADITFDLNGKTLTADDDDFVLSNYGKKLTIIDATGKGAIIGTIFTGAGSETEFDAVCPDAEIVVEGKFTATGDSEAKSIQSATGCDITIADDATFKVNNFSFGSGSNPGQTYKIEGGTLEANYGFFQHGTYALYSDFETGYMYYSFGSDITVYGTFHSQGKGDGLDYVRGKLTIAAGGKSIHEKTLWVGQPASWGAMSASLTIQPGGYVKAKSLQVYGGSTLTYTNAEDLGCTPEAIEGGTITKL